MARERATTNRIVTLEKRLEERASEVEGISGKDNESSKFLRELVELSRLHRLLLEEKVKLLLDTLGPGAVRHRV